MAFTNVLPGTTIYPELRLRWAPTTKPTDGSQTYVDITSRLKGWTWKYGRNDELGVFEAGSGSVLLDNSDRAFDPSYTASPYYGNVKPRKMFELVARWNAVEYPVFVAYAQGFPQEWPSATQTGGQVLVSLVGGEALLNTYDLVVGFTRSAELSGARIDAVLTEVGIPAGLQDTDTGTVMIDAITVDQPGTSALSYARSVAADSEFGQLFAAKDGKLTFHDRQRRLNASILHTFSDVGGGHRYDTEFKTAWDDAYLANYVRVDGAADTDPGIAENAASQLDYVTVTKTMSSRLSDYNDREALANYVVSRYAQPLQRAPALPLQGARAPSTQWPVILDLEVSDRIRIRQFDGSAVPIVLTQNVEGIRHTCKPGGPWLTEVATSPADISVYWTLGTAGKSELQSTTLLAP